MTFALLRARTETRMHIPVHSKPSDTLASAVQEEIFLRPPQMADYDQWADLRARSRGFLKPWEPSWSADDLTRNAYRRRLRRYAQEARDGTAHALFLFRQLDNVLLGGITLSNIRHGVTRSASMGYWMGEPHAGKGYMKAAVKAILPFAFQALKLHRVEAACIPENERSIRLLQSLGFQREGYAREYLCIDDEWRDHILFAILEQDIL